MKTRRSPAVAKELGAAQLGNAKRSRRLQKVTEGLMSRPGASLPRAMETEAALEGAYRFLGNYEVRPDAILEPHVRATVERVIAEGGAYCISDTTELRFGGSDRDGLGPLQGGGRGFLAHIGLAVSMDGSRLPLGVLSCETIVRPEQPKGRRGTKKSRQAEDSESLKWGRGARAANEALDGRAHLIHLMDREADIYALVAELVSAEARFVIRVAQNRLASHEEETGKLFDLLSETEEVFCRDVPLSRRTRATKQHPRRAKRSARLSFAARQLTVRRPSSASRELPPTLTLNFVHIFEKEPPPGETAIDWKLVTTEPCGTQREIEAVADAYRTRWVIEELNKALKTGCGIESCQLESIDSILNLLAIMLPVAVQLLALRSLADMSRAAFANSILSAVELHVLRAMSARVKLDENPTAEQALLAIAALGGHLQNNGPPGWIVLARGFQDLLRYVEAWAVLQNQPTK